MRVAVKIELTDIERSTLVQWSRGQSTPARLVQRAKIVLAAADGWENQAIAAELGCARKAVGEWRNRFAVERLAGIEQDAPREGQRPTLRKRFEAEIIRKTTQATPPIRPQTVRRNSDSLEKSREHLLGLASLLGTSLRVPQADQSQVPATHHVDSHADVRTETPEPGSGRSDHATSRPA